jgi:phage terminase large subunit
MSLIWPRDFKGELIRRRDLMEMMKASAAVRKAAITTYESDPVAFVNDIVWVYEPRNASKGHPTEIPAVTFKRQAEFLMWLKERFETKTSAPVEKSRDSGATWMASAFAVWLWRFHPGTVVGFGSRKEVLVDRIGDMGAIFPKIRAIIDHFPAWLLPEGWSPRDHSTYMRIINPENGSAIVGEAGDNIGRGGRSTTYFVDEAAFIERPQLVEAALTANTDVRIDISSPRVGTIFNTWCASSPHKFIFDLRDCPWHDDQWITQKKAELDSKGLGHVFRQEFLRDPAAGIAGQLISSEWVEASIGAAQKLGIKPTGKRIAALDVADGGMDRNCLAGRHGIELFRCTSRPDLLAGPAGNWAYFEAMGDDCSELRYDSIGVGAGAAEALRTKRNIKVAGFAGSEGVIAPGAFYKGTKRRNEDMFANRKAQAWWLLRDRFILTHQVIVEGRRDYDPDDLISLDPDLPELRELKSELTQILKKENGAGKTLIDKAPEGQPSPNRADSVMMAYAPAKPGVVSLGTF